MKKKVLALVMTLAMLASFLTVPASAAAGKTFPDAKGHWAEESILRWSRSGLVKGDERGNVNPDKALRRCEMATILSDMLGLRTAAPISTFKDINGTEWYARAILRCAAAGIMEGSNSMSHPEDHITREEAITMFCRALGVQPSHAPDLSDFTDGDRVSGWAAPYMATLTELGILSGMGDGSVAPHADINRAGAFTLMDKAISVYANAPGVYASQNSKGFVVVNANSTQSGDVTITGKATGVMVTVGETNTIRFRDLTAENIVVNGKGDVTVTGKSAVDALEVNTAVAVNVDKDASVNTLDVKVEKVAVNNAGTVKTLNCAQAGSVTNSGKVENLKANAASAITNTGTVDKLVANAAVTVDNTKGTVKDAEINIGGVVMDGPPQQMTVATGVARPSNSSGRPVTASGAVSSSGGGGGTRPSGGNTTTTVPATGIKLNKATMTLTEGDSEKLTATLLPSNAQSTTVTWDSKDKSVATVDQQGNVKAISEGTATITASISVTVTVPDPTPSPSPSPSNPSTTPTTEPSTTPTTEPGTTSATEHGLNEGDEEVTGLLPAAVRAGAPVTQAETTTTYTAECVVTVTKKVVAVESVTISGNTGNVKVGDTFELTAKVEPEEATDKAVTWEVTEGSDRVEILNGQGTKTIQVKASKEGPATIKATAGGKSGSIDLTVGEATATTTNVSDVKVIIDKVGEKLGVTASTYANGEITFSVDEATFKAAWGSLSDSEKTQLEHAGRLFVRVNFAVPEGVDENWTFVGSTNNGETWRGEVNPFNEANLGAVGLNVTKDANGKITYVGQWFGIATVTVDEGGTTTFSFPDTTTWTILYKWTDKAGNVQFTTFKLHREIKEAGAGE